MMKRHPELLIPASSLEVLKIAVVFGADAVYIGGGAFGLRAKAKNFSMEDMREGIAFAHEHGVKVYVTANILAHNKDLPQAREYFQELKEIKPDALIISDPGIYMIAQEICPEIERHISTQANNTNYGTYNFWYRQGASRVVSARELSMQEIKELPACPVETTLMLIGDKWKVLILRDLMPGTKRFGELKKSIGNVSQKVLTAQLRDMEANGLISRKVYAEVPPRVEYSLSELGESMRPVIKAMEQWGIDYKTQNS